MLTLYIVRHGTSQQQRLMRSRMSGIHLTAKGKKESIQAARFLKHKKIDLIYASPLERTQETANIIARAVHAKVITALELNEWNLSCIQGLTMAQIRKMPIWNNYWHHPTRLKDCESLHTVAQRMMKFYQKLLSTHRNKTIVAVSHAGTIAAFILALKHHSLDELHTIAPKRGWFPSTGGIVEVKNGVVKRVL